MTRAELLADDPLWLILIKVVVLLLIGPVMTIFLIIWERKAIGRMQQRPGPNRVGPGGYLQSLADAIKLPFKEQIIPAGRGPQGLLPRAGHRGDPGDPGVLGDPVRARGVDLR